MVHRKIRTLNDNIGWGLHLKTEVVIKYNKDKI